MHTHNTSAALQLEISWLDAETLQQTLEQQTGLDIRLVLTDNSSTFMSLRRVSDRQIALRLHRLFLTAPPHILRALTDWVKRPARKRTDNLIESFVAANGHLMRPKNRTPRLRTVGQRYDLKAIADGINRDFFDGAVTAPVTWGKRPARGKRRSIRFGSYTASDHIIRIHPALDQDFVPEYFLRYIVFHEMLHAHLGAPEGPSGRRAVHGRAFQARERAYPDYMRATAWQNDAANIRHLLR
ncbi:MAG TPA: hypothetical protein PLO62_13475 [Candidatus Hydrogenedentes bacterium]|nr:hypothetical protein [Candidatus Hydrogenedentota bacterium]HOS03103.1 hypothetical protein [Candidatus Hydrogenedentota bacterium]